MVDHQQMTRWWFQICLFSFLFGEMIQVDDRILQMGWFNHEQMFFFVPGFETWHFTGSQQRLSGCGNCWNLWLFGWLNGFPARIFRGNFIKNGPFCFRNKKIQKSPNSIHYLWEPTPTTPTTLTVYLSPLFPKKTSGFAFQHFYKPACILMVSRLVLFHITSQSFQNELTTKTWRKSHRFSLGENPKAKGKPK